MDHDETVEERLANAITDPNAWLVYADWLQEHGESWGGVMALACAGADISAKQAQVEALAGGIDGLALEWQHGVITKLTLTPEDEPESGDEMAHALHALLAHPAGRYVRQLTLGLPPQPSGDIDWNFDGLLAAITAAGPLPFLEVLDLTPDAEHMDQDSWRRLGDFEPVWDAVPRLKVLRAKGSQGSDANGPAIRFGDLVAPRLEQLIIESSGLAEAAPLEIGRAHLPALTHLELWFGQPDYGCTSTVESLRGILAGQGLPKLTRLGLCNSEWELELLQALRDAPMLSRLQVLDLSKGVLCRDAAAFLLEHAARFRHLSLVLTENYLLPDDVPALAAAFPRAQLDDQRDLEGDLDDPYARYTAVGE
jgi:uncharacterized protein (TIGR02996 family)